MAKLYCYFPDASLPTELDSDVQATCFWKVGRQPRHGDRTGLYFRGGAAHFVSMTHAAIRWRPLGYEIEGEDPGVWEIMHAGKTNPTWRGEVRGSNELPYGEWVRIEDNDRFYFGDPSNRITFGLYGFDTLTSDYEDDPPTADLSEPETLVQSPEPEIKSGHWIPDTIEEVGKLVKDLSPLEKMLLFVAVLVAAVVGLGVYTWLKYGD